MAFDPPDGILDIGNATLRVGKLEVAETSGLNQGLQNIIKNDLLVTENNESSPYTTNQKWGLKLPTTWVAEFEVKGHSGKYIDFNFYNENSASNAQGYNLTFMDTTMTLRYDGGNPLGGGAATIPTIVGAYRKVNIFFERGVISVSIDGTRYLYHKETDGFNQGLGVASRVVSATGSAFVNLFIEQNASNSAFKNLRIVNGRFISDKTSNIAFIGGNLGVGVNSPQETLDIRGNMHFNRVSNVSSISVDSNVVTEYTGPHDRPLRKYPEVNFPLSTSSESPAIGATTFTYKGYTITSNSVYNDANSKISRAFDGEGQVTSWTGLLGDYDSNGDVASGKTANYLQIQLPNAIKLENIKIISDGNYEYANGPRNITLYGSNNGSNWVTLKTETDLPLDGGTTNPDPQTAFVHVNTTTKYLYYKLEMSKIWISSGGATYARIGEWELYGHEEGSGSLDTTLKTVYNVPVTTGTQLEVYYDAKGLTTMPSTVTDLAGGDQNGAVTGHSPTLDETDGIESFNFDGSNDIIQGTFSGHTVSSGYTMATWIKPGTIGADDYIATFGVGNNGTSIGINFETIGGAFRAFVWGSSSAPLIAKTSDNVVHKDQWVHVAATFISSGGIINLYINNKLAATGSGTTLSSISASAPLVLGARNSNGTIERHANFKMANFRLYSKALNADQIKELYDYQKDYFLGSKSQVTLYKGHLGIGVAEPSGQLELAGDERIQEYPPGPMSGYETLIPGHGVFCAYGDVATDSVYLPGWPWWKVFDESESTAFHGKARNYDSTTPFAFNGSSNEVKTKIVGGSEIRGEFIDLKCPYEIMVKSMKMNPREGLTTDAYVTRMPSKCIFVGSNDGTEYEILSSHSGIVYSGTAPYSANLTINATKLYKHIRLIITHLGGSGTDNGGIVNMGHLRYFGTPGPTTLDKGSLTLGRSLDVPRISRYDVDTETPKTDYLICDLDTSVEPFNEQFINDISGAGHDMLFFANSADYNGYDSVQKAFYFNGDVYGRVVYLRELGGNAEWTQSMWFKSEEFSTSPNFNVLSFFGTKSTGLGHIWSYKADQMWQDHYGKGVYFNYTFEENKWYHAVSVYHGNTSTDPNVRSSMYINGVKQTLIASGLTSTAQNLPAPTSLELADYISGTHSSGAGGNSRHKGWISNYKMYSKALDDSDALKLYKLGRSKGTLSIPETTVLIGSGKHSSIQQVANGPNAHLDVHGHAMISGELQAMSGNFHNVLGFARGGGATNSDRWRTDNCLVCMAGQTNNSPNGSEHIGILIRRSPHYMPWTLELRQALTNNNNSNFTYRSMEMFGGISGTTIGNTAGVGGGVSVSAGSRGDDVVCFNIEVDRSSRHYGVFMIKFAYYYGIKGREY